MKNSIISYTLYLSCLLTWLAGCQTTEKASDEATEEVSLIDTTKADKPTSPYIECMAIIDVPPASVYEIHARTDGFIADLNLLEGQEVNKGTLLAKIESPDFARLQKAFLEAQSNYQWQQKNHQRSRELYEAGSIAPKEWQQAERDYQMARAQYFGLADELKAIGFDLEQISRNTTTQLEVRSKINGTVTQIDVKNGTRVSPNTHLFTIIDKRHLHAEIAIPSQYISLIKKGTPFFVPLEGDTVYGKVFLINYQTNEQNLVKVHGHFDNEHKLSGIPVGQRLFVYLNPAGKHILDATEHFH